MAMQRIGKEAQRRRGVTAPSRRWGRRAFRMRDSACPMRCIALHAAPFPKTRLPHQIDRIWSDTALGLISGIGLGVSTLILAI